MAQHMKALALVLMFGLAATVGCAEQKKPTDEAANADADRMHELEEQVARLYAERESQNARVNELEQENADLKSQLTAAPAQQELPGWKTIPGGAMIELDGEVLFDSGDATLKSSGKSTLKSVAAAIRSKYPDYDVYVFGHTDNQPIKLSKWKDNWELSCQRALSVVRFLGQNGIAPQSLLACGAGEERPAVPNDSSANRQKNRRVQVFAMAPRDTKVAQSKP